MKPHTHSGVPVLAEDRAGCPRPDEQSAAIPPGPAEDGGRPRGGWRLGLGLALLHAALITATAQDLIVTAVDYASGCATIDFLTPEPAGRHQLEVSADLRTWEPVPIATFQVQGASALRTGLAGVPESPSFFRISLWESPATNPPVYVNLQVDAELEDTQGLRTIMAELEQRQIAATVYVTADYANRNALLIAELFQHGFEVALHGYYTGEQLASMTYEQQKDLLARAKLALEGCKPCGTYKPIVGFRPQYFSQNDDTYRVLDELALTHNSGFKVGQLYLPGHTWQAAPYAATGHSFSVIPITTVPVGCDRAYLCDLACGQVLHWTPDQWRDGLLQALAEALETRQPLVVLLHGYYAGDAAKYGYWQPVLEFLDAAAGKVTFVQSKDLVDLASQP